MEFFIDGLVRYNSDDGTLLSPDNTLDVVTLTRVTSELLSLFIKSNNTPISREAILSELWEKRGLTASSNNLNNHVSMLRKALSQCGCDDLITTIPKYGFLFEAQVEMLSESNEKKGSDIFYSSGELKELSGSGTFGKIFELRYLLKNTRVCSVMLALILMIIFLFFDVYDKWHIRAIRSEILTINQCKFYILDDVTRRLNKTNIINTLKAVTNKEGVDCRYKTDLYFFQSIKKDASGNVSNIGLLSSCSDDNIPCNNYYFSK